MNRQGAARLRISSLHIQQGLFALLALLITLVGGQQLMRWEQSQQPEPVHQSIPHAPQTHFSALGDNLTDSAAIRMMDVDQTQPVDETPAQERWVF
ncbi:hypothetical protein HCU66_13460 [Pseudomonas frederiksbergensis]|uniref:hypothetical protein n=1 Tax=Pseudomonas frederiksbergensis TaxID=104087 RepID=UPI0019825354|nr:hypothetical protein [Pseudomonas frederiksbergensis]MBN3863238.1 hypothetical protein [Pseudomonas frederiksbergensis]